MSKEFSWYGTITGIVKDVIKGSKLTSFFIGTVENTSPLKIKRDEKFILDESNLTLTNAVRDYKAEVTIDGQKREMTIHNALKMGEKVLVLQNNGGQEFVILERVSDT